MVSIDVFSSSMSPIQWKFSVACILILFVGRCICNESAVSPDNEKRVKFDEPNIACIECDSRSSQDCLTDPRNVQTSCLSSTNECFTQLSEKSVTRGCIQNDQFPDSDKQVENLIEKCSDRSKCNDRAITPEYCYAIKYGKDDKLQIKPEHSKHCQLAMRPVGCYHVDLPNGTVIKGCVSDISLDEVNKYSTKPMEYATCVGHNCNSRQSILSCLSCKSKRPNDECALNKNRIPLKVCKNYHDKCYTRISVNSMVARGCLEDASEEVATDCSDPTNIRCELCDSENGCNNHYVREKCLELEYQKGSAAIVTASSSVRCRLQSKPMGCYHFEDKATGLVKKGCVGHLSDAEFANYARQMPYFQICLGESCNSRYEIFSCLRCESMSGNDTCLSNLEQVDSVVCGKYRDECFTRITENNIERGCLSQLSKETIKECRSDPKMCSTCDNRQNCNDLPKKHEHCYAFDSSSNCRLATELSNDEQSMACGLTVPQLGCYHFEIPEKRITRKGCISDLQPSQLQIYGQQQQHFFKCSGDNCNGGGMITSCFVCKSNGVDGHCVTDYSDVLVKACPIYGDKCYTRITNGNEYERGCLSKASEIVAKACGSNSGKCEICDEVKCNNHAAIDHCVSCNSGHDAKCQHQPDKVDSVHCSLKTSSDSSKPAGCYLKYNGQEAIRGCVEDLNGDDLRECSSSNSANCQICDGHRCNERISFRQSCFKCKSSVLKSCLNLTEPILVAECKNYTDSCLVGIDASGHTHRKCGHEKQAKLDFPYGFETCHGEQCNDFVYPKGRLRCLQCQDCGKTFDQSRDLAVCEVYSTSSQCYTFKADGKVNRGCLSDDEKIATACIGGSENCLTCNGDGCNDEVMNHSSKASPTTLLIVTIIAIFALFIE